MKKTLSRLVLTSTLMLGTLSADALKDSLTNIMKKKDSPGMVNLDGLSIDAKHKPKVAKQIRHKSRPGTAVIGHYHDGKAVRKKEADRYIKKVTKGKIKDIDRLPRKQRFIVLKDLQNMYKIKHFKSRPKTAVIATVNGVDILKKEADGYLEQVTRGKVKDFDRLDTKQRRVLIEDLARPIVLRDAVMQDISPEEKEAIFKQIWIEKQRATIEVSSEEMLELYELKKEKSLALNPQAQIPHFMSLGDSLKNEILEQKMMANLMRDVNITVNDDSNVTNTDNNDSNESSETLGKIQNTKET